MPQYITGIVYITSAIYYNSFPQSSNTTLKHKKNQAFLQKMQNTSHSLHSINISYREIKQVYKDNVNTSNN